MKTPFFITGFPRSRTAWMANLFTTERTLCFHDLTTAGRTVHELVNESPSFRVGVSDPLLTLMHESLIDSFPNSHWLYVERNANESMISLLQFVRPIMQPKREQMEQLYQKHERAARRLRKLPNVKTVSYDRLDDYATILAAWYHLIPEVPFQEARWEILQKFRIECLLPQANSKGGLCRQPL